MRLSIFIILISSLSASGQTQISLRTGYGMYAMKEMKSFQSELLSQIEYPMRITESFPGYAYYEGSVRIPLANKCFWMLNVGYGSTGGRIHYSDYSGEFRFDQLPKFISAGTALGISLENNSGKYVFDLRLTPSLLLTSLNLEFLSRIGDVQNVETIELRSRNFTLQPDITLTRKLGRIGILVMAGYNFGVVNGQMYLKSNSNAYLTDSSGNKVRANWDGLRAAVGLSYAFGEK